MAAADVRDQRNASVHEHDASCIGQRLHELSLIAETATMLVEHLELAGLNDEARDVRRLIRSAWRRLGMTEFVPVGKLP